MMLAEVARAATNDVWLGDWDVLMQKKRQQKDKDDRI